MRKETWYCIATGTELGASEESRGSLEEGDVCLGEAAGTATPKPQ
jgi:hypothetical protein